jgi:hypothetical protein
VITLEPTSGLCNRMRAIDGTLALARSISADLRIVWARNDLCGAPFSALFEPLPGAVVRDRSRWAHRLLRRVERHAGRHTRFLGHAETYRLFRSDYDFRELKREASTYIRTNARFFPTEPLFAAFVPVAPLAAEIERVASAFISPTLGVHIRRTDNAESIRRSPTSRFLERMGQELERNRDTRFFLATDAFEVEAEILAAFPGRVLTRPRVYDRASTAGVRDAVVDLYCLARTHRILGSFYSSFSDTAAEIGGVPLEIIDVLPSSPS